MAHDLIVFGEDWGAHPSSSQHLVSHMAADRHVVWVNSIGLRKPAFSMGDAARAARKLGAALFSTPAPRPTDLPEGGPVAGFYGSLAPWIDLDLVAATARLLPEWRFVMIGAAQTDLSALEGLGNIHRLGARPHAALPGYAQHWDAGIIPFRDTAQIRACNPLKLREYLAAGRPVVSTDFPALDGYRHLVQVARTPEDFAAALGASLADTNAAARQAAVAAQSWAARAAEAAAWTDAL
ncbi:glycosyltransferase [Sediminicoccus sp. BL-A-41-H5]|uniref:glycosyltransferase n=1 Tax=Sediminicoccus sp. BL-A-41-H5 TaxID=3421106 RepID=UPI003D666D53